MDTASGPSSAGQHLMESDKTPERQAADWFIALREEPDDVSLATRFEHWLMASSAHAAAWKEMGETARLLGAVSQHAATLPLPTLKGGRRRAAANFVGRHYGKAAMAMAASVAGLILAGPAMVTRMEADHVTGSGEVKSVQLSDGSNIELGPDSAVAIDYRAGQRTVRLLAGRAMFEVRHDPHRVFRVAAGDVSTRVLGTGFEVRKIKRGATVAVLHGRVAVDSQTGNALLQAGDWVSVDGTEGITHGHQIPQLTGSWSRRSIILQNRTIEDAIDELRPWFNGRIILADRDLRQRTVTGVYDARRPARSLSLMVSPYGGAVQQITPWLLIVTRQW